MKKVKEVFVTKKSVAAIAMVAVLGLTGCGTTANTSAVTEHKVNEKIAEVQEKKIEVKFMDGDKVVATKEVADVKDVKTDGIVPDMTSHPYEDFVKWEKKTDDKNIADTASDSVIYTAVFKGKTYNINYNLDGGTTESPVTYVYGEGVETLAPATKDGFTFDGWFLDEAKTQKCESVAKEYHGDLNLYAGFTENAKPVEEQPAQAPVAQASQPAQTQTQSAPVQQSQPQAQPVQQAPVQQAQPVQQAPVATPAPAAPAPATPAPTPVATPEPAPVAVNEPVWNYVGTYGAVWMDNGYQVALESWSQSNVDKQNTAAYDSGSVNGVESMADHKNGTPAFLPAMQNSSRMVIRYSDGSTKTLYKKGSVIADAWNNTTDDGNYVYNRSYVASYGASFVCQTCYQTYYTQSHPNGTNYITFWG